MKYINYLLILQIIVGLINTSCTPSMYSFNTTNVPMLADKKQGNVAGIVGLQNFEVQASYSFAKDFGILANIQNAYSFSIEKNTNKFDLGVGYYKLLKSKYFVDSYFGIGLGNRQINYNSDWKNWLYGSIFEYKIYNVNSHFTNGFVQSSVYYKSDYLSIAFTAQFESIYFNSFQFVYKENGTKGQAPNQLIDNSALNQNSLNCLNSAITLRLGENKLNFFSQLKFNHVFKQQRQYNIHPYQISIGINCKI